MPEEDVKAGDGVQDSGANEQSGVVAKEVKKGSAVAYAGRKDGNEKVIGSPKRRQTSEQGKKLTITKVCIAFGGSSRLFEKDLCELKLAAG